MGKRILGIKKASDKVIRCAHPEVVQKQDGRFQCSKCNKYFSLDDLREMDRAMLVREVSWVSQFQSVN